MFSFFEGKRKGEKKRRGEEGREREGRKGKERKEKGRERRERKERETHTLTGDVAGSLLSLLWNRKTTQTFLKETK